MIRIGTVPPSVEEIESQTTDKFGNVLPTVIITPDQPEMNWKAYDYADAFLELMTSPTSADEADIHQLTEDLGSIGTLSKFIWLAPYIGGNAADHSLNLRYPFAKGGNRVTFHGGVTHNSDGIQGGASMFAKNGLHLLQMNPQSFSMGLYSLDSALTTDAVPEMGFGNADTDCTVFYLGNHSYYASSPFFCNKTWLEKLTFSITDASGQFDCVMSNAKKAVARNGSIIASSTSNLGFIAAGLESMTLLAYTGKATGNARRIAMHYVGEYFSDTEIADNYTAFQTFQTSRGRNV